MRSKKAEGRYVKGDFLFGKRPGPFHPYICFEPPPASFVVAHRFPFRAILRSFWQMHFFAHEIRASEYDAHTQRCSPRNPFPKLLD